jgi:hypothetical protein
MEYSVLPVVGEDPGKVSPADIPSTPGELSLRYLRAQLMAGPYWYSTAYLQRLRSRFPMDTSLAMLDFLREERASLAFREWIDLRSAAGQEIPRRILLHGVIYGSTPEIRRDLAEGYTEAGGNDPLAKMALDREYLREEDEWKTDKIAWEMARTWFDEEFYDDLSLPPGEVILTVDRDRDSFWEERYHLVDGNVHLWEEDGNQNGLVDRRVQIDGEVRRVDVTVRLPGEEVLEIRYAPYPLVSEVLLLRPQGDPEKGYRTVRWQAAQPPRFPVGLDNVVARRWDGRHEEVTVNTDRLNRFRRQLDSDDARFLSSSETDRFVELLVERGIMY